MTPDRRHHSNPRVVDSRFHRLEGAALIIVLSCLVLVTALLIGFLSRAQTERGNSASYRGGMGSRNLADYAVNIVMAQIRDATTGANAANAWASQPGAIRVYDSAGNNPVAIYKLYSAVTNMVGSSVSDLMSDTNPSGWAANTALYTDLNAPVITGSGAGALTNYPILDPGALGVVQGFTNEIVAGVNSATNPVPMPVTWLYVLENGTLVAPRGGPSNSVTVDGAASNNPIVGRIAFWTDDDTCKININTASGAPWNYTNTRVTNWWGNTPANRGWGEAITNTTPANYWDVPMMDSGQDKNLAISQPWAAEFQRYPGHPATISLSAVFTNLTTNDIMAIAPRITYQNLGSNVGSQWGSFVATNGPPSNNSIGSITAIDTGQGPAFRYPDDRARLYANVDELLYATNRSVTGTNPVTPRQIEQSRFFLTASSRAPDVTLFNTPRLLCWPITFTTGNTNKITPYDQLIAFCGTVGANTNYGSTNSYYFTRWDSLNATTDYNVARNQTLLGYLKRMTETPVPGYGGDGILSKYTTANESDQIRTEIFDYIRCINSRDMSMESNGTVATVNQYTYAISNSIIPTAGINDTRGFGRFPTVTKVGMLFWFNNYYTNLVNNAGIVTTNTNVSLCARVLLEPFYASHGYPDPQSRNMHRFTVTGLDSLRWGTNPDTATMTPIFNISGSGTFTIGGESMGWGLGGRRGVTGVTPSTFNPNATNLASVSATNTLVPATIFFNADTTNNVTDSSGDVVASYTNSTFSFSGGSLTIRIADGSDSYVNQTITVYLPPFTNLPVPRSTFTSGWPTRISGSNSFTVGNNSFNGLNAWTSASFAWTNAINPAETSTNLGRLIYASTLFRPQDVVRSVGVVHGDFRITAARPTVGTNVFAPVNGGVGAYTNTNPIQAVAHNFVGEYPYSAGGARFPKQNYYSTNTSFTDGTTTNPNTSSEFGFVNATTNGTFQWRNGDAVELSTAYVTGDWDCGYGNSGNGPYTGFPDEGNARVMRFQYSGDSLINFGLPYLDGSGVFLGVSSGFFSPNRLVPSAGIMGSLPTGVMSQTPWQTLLFRPAALTSSTHPGLNNPPDYLLLDLFNMPVVEPYAISEPLSTAGRVNMNYQILPFTYIKRSTALRAALHTEWMLAIPTANGGSKVGNNITAVYRYPLNLDTNTGTLRGFENRFGNNEIFRSAAEICSIPLVPTNSNWTSVNGTSATGFWRLNSGTGDNAKERPYTRIYPKLTTKSNTYTVHYRVEVLKKSPNSTSQNTWNEGQDKVLSTYRGSTTIERYVSPRDPRLPDYASPTIPIPVTGTNALGNFYSFRVVGERHFNP